jgi:hypothetical protein
MWWVLQYEPPSVMLENVTSMENITSFGNNSPFGSGNAYLDTFLNFLCKVLSVIILSYHAKDLIYDIFSYTGKFLSRGWWVVPVVFLVSFIGVEARYIKTNKNRVVLCVVFCFVMYLVPKFGWSGPDSNQEMKDVVSDVMSMHPDYVNKEDTLLAEMLRDVRDVVRKECRILVDEVFVIPLFEKSQIDCYDQEFDTGKRKVIDKLFSSEESTFCEIVERHRIPLHQCTRAWKKIFVPYQWCILLFFLYTLPVCVYHKYYENPEAEPQASTDNAPTTTVQDTFEERVNNGLRPPQRRGPRPAPPAAAPAAPSVVKPRVSPRRLRSRPRLGN